MSNPPTKTSEKLPSTISSRYTPETMESLITRLPNSAIDDMEPLSPIDDLHLKPKAHSPSFSTDFLERQPGQALAQNKPIRVHSLVRKLGNHALAQAFENHEDHKDYKANDEDAITGSAAAKNPSKNVAPEVPFPLHSGVLDLSDDEDEYKHEPEPEPEVVGVITDGLFDVASATVITPPAAEEVRTSESHDSIFGPDSSATAPPVRSATSWGKEPAVMVHDEPDFPAQDASTAPVPDASAAPVPKKKFVPADGIPDASVAIGSMPSFPRGFGIAPGETRLAGPGKKKEKKFSFTKMFQSKKPAETTAPAQLSTAEKRAKAARERDARIREAEAEKEKAVTTRTDIAPSTNPAILRGHRVELLARKKTHLREARMELALAQRDVRLLEESIEDLETELAATS